MAAINPVLQSQSSNRRRRVRHRIQTPAYASFTAESKSAMLDLHEIVNVSEDGVAIQCSTPLEVNRNVELCLDLAECEDHIYTTAQVVWSDPTGRSGLRFSDLPPVSLFRLREWLFLNAMTGAAANESAMASSTASLHVPTRPNYTDTLAGVTAVQRQVEALGSDLHAALKLIAERAQNLVRASGAAIALAGAEPDLMECRASSGDVAPPVGVRLQVGSGFSGECVKSGMLLRCDDSETDSRVDRESCRALGVRSILAAPVRAGDRVGEKSVGILEVFAPAPFAFTENDSRVLQRLADLVVSSINRSAVAENLPPIRPAHEEPRFAPVSSVLFASTPQEEEKAKADQEEKRSSGISLPRSLLYILMSLFATIALAMGYVLAPWIQAEISPWLQKKFHTSEHSQLQTVLASSQPPKPVVETATFDQLKQLAEGGDPAAQNALGLRYFQGDEKNQIQQDEHQAFRWFTAAAEGGNLAAQSKLGFLYWSGRGAPKDVNKAYFWTVLARARGDEGSKDLAAVLASGMTRAQTTTIEQQAEVWLQQHQATASKPNAGLAMNHH